MTKFNPDQVIYDFDGKTPMRIPTIPGHVGPIMTARRAMFATLRNRIEGDDKASVADTMRLHSIGHKLWAPTVDVKARFIGDANIKSLEALEKLIDEKGETVAEAMADAMGAALQAARDKAKPKAAAGGEGKEGPVGEDASIVSASVSDLEAANWIEFDSDETTMILDRCHKVWPNQYVDICQIVDPARLKK